MGARTGRARGSRADRVSTTDQDTATQQAKLREAGWTLVRIEKVSGRSRDGRSELEAVMAFSRPGDAPVAVKLDRRVAEPDFCPPTMRRQGRSAQIADIARGCAEWVKSTLTGHCGSRPFTSYLGGLLPFPSDCSRSDSALSGSSNVRRPLASKKRKFHV
jgi:hypothetical protein